MVEKPIDQVEEGDVLARSVTDGSGNVLVHQGVAITKTLTRVLMRRGVETVEIRDPADPESHEPAPEAARLSDDRVVRQNIENMRERLVIAFAPHVENVTMAVLYKSVMDYLTQKYQAQAAQPDDATH